MNHAKLVILIASFAFSTAVMAKPSAPKTTVTSVVETGTTPTNVNPSNCPFLTAGSQNSNYNDNRTADQARVYEATNGRAATVKGSAVKTTL